MKKKIIKIDESLCTGCGNCVVSCRESALQIIDGKAKLVRENFCDGLGNCIGTCPTGALSIIEKERNNNVESFDVPCSCPSMESKTFNKTTQTKTNTSSQIEQVIPSELNQWPVQLHLVNPSASYFVNSELVVLSTCSAVASPDIHWRYLRGRAVVVACPKLDRLDGYVEKLAEIFKQANTPKVITVMMDVPCCNGLSRIVKSAINLSEKTNIELEEPIITLDGKLKI